MATLGVVGSGLIGAFIAKSLCRGGHSIHAFDRDERRLAALEEGITGHVLDVSLEHPVESLQADAWVNALPGEFGAALRFEWMTRGQRVVDLSFTREDARELHAIALEHGGSLVLDAGIAPGLSNLMLARSQSELGPLDKGVIRVGGIPLEPDEEWSYMAPFSPADVIEEYEREVRLVEDGRIVRTPALGRRHIVDFSGMTDGVLGSLEAFLTDGLRSLLDNIESQILEEYTLRWPGHIERFIELQNTGDLEGEERAGTISELLAAWEFDSSRPECTILQVEALTASQRQEWVVFDTGSEEDSSMARTTGLVTVALVEEMLAGSIPEGVHAPETLEVEGMLRRICERMSREGVMIRGSF